MIQFLYFDPGTGALIAQFVAAAVAGVVLFYKTITYKLKSMFGIKGKPSDDLPSDDLPSDDDQKPV